MVQNTKGTPQAKRRPNSKNNRPVRYGNKPYQLLFFHLSGSGSWIMVKPSAQAEDARALPDLRSLESLPERIALELRVQEAADRARRRSSTREGSAAESELRAEFEQLKVLCEEARLALSTQSPGADATSVVEPQILARKDTADSLGDLRNSFTAAATEESRDVRGKEEKEAGSGGHKFAAVATAVMKANRDAQGHEEKEAGSGAHKFAAVATTVMKMKRRRSLVSGSADDIQEQKAQIIRRLSMNCLHGTPEEIAQRRKEMQRQLGNTSSRS